MTKRQMEKRFASGGEITTMEDGEEAVLTYCDMCGKLYKGDYGYEVHLARHKARYQHDVAYVLLAQRR